MQHDLVTYGLIEGRSGSNIFVGDETITHHLKEYMVRTGSRTKDMMTYMLKEIDGRNNVSGNSRRMRCDHILSEGDK